MSDWSNIQGAINMARPSVGGSGEVVLTATTYHLDHPLTIPDSVTLRGKVRGPVEPHIPGAIVRGTTFCIEHTEGPAIIMSGVSSRLSDVMLYYSGQAAVSDSVPVVYPYVIETTAPCSIERVSIVNAYDGIKVSVGRTLVRDCLIGAMHNGIVVDGPQDWVLLDNITQSIFWDIASGYSTAQPIDNWVMANSNGLVVGKVDSLHVKGMLVFKRRVGISLGMLTPESFGYGSMSDIDLDNVVIGIVAYSANSPGFHFSNLNIGAVPGLGSTALFYMPGSESQPTISIANGVARGIWAGGAISGWPAGRLLLANWTQV